MSENDVLGEIYIPPRNSMSAKFRVIGQGKSEILAEITAKEKRNSDILAEITPRVERANEKLSVINAIHGGNNDVLAEIQPLGGVMIPAVIEVKSGNRMRGIFEVQEPPKLIEILNPVADSYTREKPPYNVVNFGKDNSLLVGRYDNDIYRSFIRFNFDDWSSQNTIIDVKLRLYYLGNLPANGKLELFTVNSSWTETGITHNNRPSPKDLITVDYVNYPQGKYIEFEFTDITVDWVKNKIVNNGFLIRAPIEVSSELFVFRSRESSTPPELVVTYYDNRIYSAARTSTLAEITVQPVRDNDRLAEITVKSVFGKNDVKAQLYVHRPEDPMDNDMYAEITVTKPDVWATLSVAVLGGSDTLAEISSRSPLTNNSRDAEITVTKPDIWAEIFAAFSNDVLAEIEVRKQIFNTVNAEISVTRPEVFAEIDVRYKSSIEAVITSKGTRESDKFAVIYVTTPDVFAEISVKNRSDVYATIRSVRGGEDVTLAEINVTTPDRWAEITAVKPSDVEAEIGVKFNSNIEAEIDVLIHSNVMAKIDVIKASKVQAEINVTTPDRWAEITVPYYRDSDVLAIIYPRIRSIDDLYAEITVARKAGAYVFMM